MLPINDLIDIQTLSESVELEFKLAQGKEGRGKLPEDFWPTYSAMANSRGGYVVLGVKEKKRKRGSLVLLALKILKLSESKFLISQIITKKLM